MFIQKTANRNRKPPGSLRALAAGLLLASMVCEAGAQAQPVWMPLFDGSKLTGWGYTADYWGVDSGMIQGQGKATYNTFCHTNRKYSDFVLSVKARLWQTQAGYTNSGLQYRSVFIDSATHRMKGYQVDIGDNLDGSMYPEGAYPPDAKQVFADPCRKFIKPNNWNHYLVTANGGKVKHELNGNFCMEYTATVLDGYVGLQLHATSTVMKVDFKDIYIRPLNNSFAIPESLATVLDDGYSSGVRPHAAAVKEGINVIGDRLFIPASFWTGRQGAGRHGVVDISLRDFTGRTKFSRPVRTAGIVPMEISLPALGAGGHILSVTGIGNAYSGIVHQVR
jgi:hypothetical protein